MTVLPQRPLKGSRISTFYPVKSLPPLSSLDSAFQLQEYISLLIRLDIHDVDAIVSVPDKAGKDGGGDGSPEAPADAEGATKNDFAVDEACWIYEQLRRLAQDLSHPLITMLQQECTRASCPEMKAGEWLYLCVAHGNDGSMEQCCAIDYILHTVDSATALLNSRAFPSRLSIPQSSHRHFSSLARRLGRIFAHAYFHHREIFEQAEAESSLYPRFLALTSKFELVPPEFLVIPPRLSREDSNNDVEPPRLLGAAVEPQLHNTGGASSEEGRDSSFEDRGRDISGLARSYDPQSVQEQPQSTDSNVQRNPSPWKGRSRTDTMVYSEAFSVAEELAKANEDESYAQAQSPLDVSAPSDELTAEVDDDSVEANTAGEDPPSEIDPDLVDGVPVSSSGEPTEMDIPHIPSAQTTEHDLTDSLVQAAEPSLEDTDEFSGIDPALAREPQVIGEEEEVTADAPTVADGTEEAIEADDKDESLVEEGHEEKETAESVANEGDISTAEVEAALVPTQDEAEPPSVTSDDAEESKEESEAAPPAEEALEELKVEEKDVSEANEVKTEEKEGETTPEGDS